MDKVQIQLKLYGSSKILSNEGVLYIQLPENSNIEQLRKVLSKIISEKYLESNLAPSAKTVFLEKLPTTAAFFSEKDEVVNDSYKLKDKELISIIPPIGGG